VASNAWAANPPSEEVKAQVRKATGEYNLGQYLDAAKDYEAAYLQTLDANLLFNVAQSYRLAGERDKAIAAYRSYIRSAPRGEQRALAESKLRDLEQQRASAPATAPSPPPPASPQVPTAASPTAASPPAILAPAPTVGTSAMGPGPGTTPQADNSNVPNVLFATPAPEPPKSSPFYARWPFWTATGAVVAGAVVVGVVLSHRGSTLNMPNPTLGSKVTDI
jgi:tetratricopeptide (TPR) repeat protein